jgi:probable addiction module antidote protein
MIVKTKPYDSADYLQSEDAVAAYLEEFLEDDDPTMLLEALGTVARARGMSEVAKKAGLTRNSLYKSLNPNGNPELSTFLKVLRAMGLQIAIKPIDAPLT